MTIFPLGFVSLFHATICTNPCFVDDSGYVMRQLLQSDMSDLWWYRGFSVIGGRGTLVRMNDSRVREEGGRRGEVSLLSINVHVCGCENIL